MLQNHYLCTRKQNQTIKSRIKIAILDFDGTLGDTTALIVRTTQAVMVGDTIFDIEMGLNAGTKTCGVTYGNGSRASLAKADWLIDGFGKLADLIN